MAISRSSINRTAVDFYIATITLSTFRGSHSSTDGGTICSLCCYVATINLGFYTIAKAPTADAGTFCAACGLYRSAPNS